MASVTTWNPELYDQKHAFIYQYGESLLGLLSPQPGESILDLGCGTGHLTHMISEKGAHVIGIDSAEEMIAKAKAAFPEVVFVVKNATDFSFPFPFDAVFSNAVLHWIPEQELVVQQLFQCLKPGGRMVIEMGGKGNIQSILTSLRQELKDRHYEENAAIRLWYFPSIGEYATLLEKTGFQVQLAQHFDRITVLDDPDRGLADWIDMFCGAFFKGIPKTEREAITLAVQQSLRHTNFHEGRWFADYKRLRIIAVKPSN